MKQKRNNKVKKLDASEVKQTIRILHTKGLTSEQIAVECSMSVGLVRKILKDLGYKENPERRKEKHIWADSCHYKDKELREKYGD